MRSGGQAAGEMNDSFPLPFASPLYFRLLRQQPGMDAESIRARAESGE